MTTDTLTYRQFAFVGKRSHAEQAADVFTAYAQNAPGSSLAVVLDANDAEVIACPRTASVTTRQMPGRMLVAVLPEGTR